MKNGRIGRRETWLTDKYMPFDVSTFVEKWREVAFSLLACGVGGTGCSIIIAGFKLVYQTNIIFRVWLKFCSHQPLL